jgi:hypothetical protein
MTRSKERERKRWRMGEIERVGIDEHGRKNKSEK